MVESITAIRRRCGAWVALLALTFQLGLSIGHVHQFGQDRGPVTALSRAGTLPGSAHGRLPAKLPPVPQDECPICFGLAVSGTFIQAASINGLLVPCLGVLALHTPARIIDLPRRPFSPAQQRAPPPAEVLA
jgi:hypothetical protein